MSLILGSRFVVQAEGTPGRERLNSYISFYQDGDYRKAADSIDALIPMLTDPEDQMNAYKYLGFSYAMLNRIDKSKDAFKTALKKYSAMEIDTLEVPPNITIIFKQAKLELKLEKIDTTKTVRTYIIVQKKNIALPTILLSLSVVSLGAGANLAYYGYQQRQKYNTFNTPDQKILDKYYNNSIYSFIGAGVCGVTTCVLFPISLYLYNKKESPERKVSFTFINGVPSLACSF